MTDDEFEMYVSEAVDSLPREFGEKLENVTIFVENVPSQEQLHKLRLRGDALLLGLYEGIPKTKRGNYGIGMTLPDRITIFKYPILQIASRKEQIVEIIRDTVRHEIAHYFGLDEHQVRNAERSRKIKP